MFFLIFFLFIFPSLYCNQPVIDLNDLAQDCVLESSQIIIPEFPGAFNPSIVKWEDGYLMSFRTCNPGLIYFNSRIGLVKLNKDFEPIGEAKLLSTPFDSAYLPQRSEDARLIIINHKLWMVYSDGRSFLDRGGTRIFLAELEPVGSEFHITRAGACTKFQGENVARRERNWVPFEYQNQLLLAYTISPHRILLPTVETGSCETLMETQTPNQWQWGELRGGTPALLDGDHYLSFFHSCIRMKSIHSKNKETPHYFFGAYTFSKEPPFEIQSMSPRPIIGNEFYTDNVYKPYWGAVNVVFPCGFIFDHHYIWIVFGKHDHECWITKIDKQLLLDSLITLEHQ